MPSASTDQYDITLTKVHIVHELQALDWSDERIAAMLISFGYPVHKAMDLLEYANA